LQLALGDSIVSILAPKDVHMRSTPHLPLATYETEPENIIKKGKDSQEGFSIVVSGTSSHLPDSTFNTPGAISNNPPLPSAEISRNLEIEFFFV
jgi:hypothetical protein